MGRIEFRLAGMSPGRMVNGGLHLEGLCVARHHRRRSKGEHTRPRVCGYGALAGAGLTTEKSPASPEPLPLCPTGGYARKSIC